MNNKEICFSGKIVRKVYGNNEFRIYAVEVDEETIRAKGLKKTVYGTVSVLGNIHELGIGLEYKISAIENYNEKNGYSYKLINITRDKPKSAEDMFMFLKEILTENQATTLYNVYPNIVDKVVNNDLDDIDLSKTPGIKEYTFNIIKQKIVENYALADLMVEFKGFLSLSMINKIYQKYTSVMSVRNALRKEPYECLCSLSGVGFIKADAILLELEKENVIEFECDLRSSRQRCLACMMYQLEQNENNGNTNMDIIELRKVVMKLTPACADHFVECLKREELYYDKDKMVCALKRTYETEKHIANIIKNSLKINNVWNIDTSKYTKVDGFELSDEQKRLTKLVCENSVSILNGNAGGGKTASMKSVTNMCQDNNKSFLLLSPSAKAAVVLEDSTGCPASTIHKGLGYPDPDTKGWTYNKENKLPHDLVVIDEFSMVGCFLFSHVIDAIDFTRTKLLLIGDDAQLPSIECSNLLYDFLSSSIIPNLTLTKIFRYKVGGIMSAATDTRMSKQYLFNGDPAVKVFGEDNGYTFINLPDEMILKQTIALYKKLYSKEYQEKNGLELKPLDVQIITAKNVGQYGTIVLNNAIQRIANKENYGSSTCMKFKDRTFFVGDCVIQTQNNYHSQVYIGDIKEEFSDSRKKNEVLICNGQSGFIKDINVKEQYAVIDFGGTLIKYTRGEMESINHAYAITCHRSQGSSIPIVILLSPRADCFIMNSNLLYVGVSRSKQLCFHIGSRDAVNMSIKKKENFKRQTFMQDLLKQN